MPNCPPFARGGGVSAKPMERRAQPALRAYEPTCLRPFRSAYTLVEIVLVVGLIALISAIAIPAFYRQMKEEELPGSGKQMRSLLSLVRANAAMDGRRYRIRFPNENETDAIGTDRQPIIEREDDPVLQPELFVPVRASWAIGVTLLGDVWCAEVRLGKPTIEELQARREAIKEQVKKKQGQDKFEPERPPLIIEPDGTSDWATFAITLAPRDTDIEDLEEHPRLEVILDGVTGLGWLQRPFYDSELDLFEEKGWPAVLAQDYVDPTEITEDRVLEVSDFDFKRAAAAAASRSTKGSG